MYSDVLYLLLRLTCNIFQLDVWFDMPKVISKFYAEKVSRVVPWFIYILSHGLMGNRDACANFLSKTGGTADLIHFNSWTREGVQALPLVGNWSMAFPVQTFNSWLKGQCMSQVVRSIDQVTEGIRRELQDISWGKRLRMVEIEIKMQVLPVAHCIR